MAVDKSFISEASIFLIHKMGTVIVKVHGGGEVHGVMPSKPPVQALERNSGLDGGQQRVWQGRAVGVLQGLLEPSPRAHPLRAVTLHRPFLGQTKAEAVNSNSNNLGFYLDNSGEERNVEDLAGPL